MSEGTQAIVEVIERLAKERETFTSDDIRPLLPATADVLQIPSAVQRARRSGLIEEVGRVRSTILSARGALSPSSGRIYVGEARRKSLLVALLLAARRRR